MVSAPRTPLCEPEDAVIATSGSLTAIINLRGHILYGMFMPAVWTTAGVTFSGSVDGTTFADIHNDSGEVLVVGTAGKYFSVDPLDFSGINYLQVRSGTAATPVAQAAERTIIMSMGKPDFR